MGHSCIPPTSLTASVNTSINTDPDDGGNEQGPSSQSILQTYMDVSNTFIEGSGKIIDDWMSPDHDIKMPFGLPQLRLSTLDICSPSSYHF